MTEIGVVGTGIMGGHMARRLATVGGFPTRAWNRDAAKIPAEAQPSELTALLAASDVVIVMLSTGEVIDAVLFESGAINAIKPGAALVVMSSIPVETCRRHATRVPRYLDAPVSGGEEGARDGTLAILAGGDPALVDELRLVFAALGRVTHLGPVGAGQATKLANQIIVGGTMLAVAEALTFAASNGADPVRVRGALTGGFGDSRVLQLHGARMVERHFTPGSPAEYQLKDLRTARALAEAKGKSFVLLDTLERVFADMLAHQGPGVDVSGVIREVERRA